MVFYNVLLVACKMYSNIHILIYFTFYVINSKITGRDHE